MLQQKTLPKLCDLSQLSKAIGRYPIAIHDILVLIDKNHNFSHLSAFLTQFSDDVVFCDASDFMTQARELRLLLREKQSMPHEILRSPQD